MPELTWETPQPPRIIVIDDNPSVHDAFQEILAGKPVNTALEKDEAFLFGTPQEPPVAWPQYRIDHALSGAEGVEQVRAALAAAAPYQVAFVDIRMPGMDGVETIERMWALDHQVQTVICTAYADYRWEDLARRLGRTDRLLMLKKPFHNIEIMQLASTLAQKWQLARQAALKLEQIEALVARRTQRVLELQRRENAMSPSPVAAAGEPAAASAEADLPLVLLILDQLSPRESLTQALQDGYQVLAADSAEQGRTMAREQVPDLIVVDERAAPRQAIPLCTELKQDELTSHIPVLLLASADDEKLQLQALEAGVSEFLIPPLRLPLLRARADNLLENRRKWHEHFQQLQTVQPRELAGSQLDAEFLHRVVEIVEKNLEDYEFDVEKLARQLAVSRRQLFRKFKALAG
ncbi:MAG TPA: response regulator, partial [Verrucomicrobiae bacterium]